MLLAESTILEKHSELAEPQTEQEQTTGKTSLVVSKGFIMVAHFICVLFCAFVVYTAKPGTSLFSWHPALMTMAFMLLMAEAILIFSPQSSFLTKAARPQKVRFHWISMVTALLCSGAGVFAIWYNKELNGSPHMTSWHGTLGYITCAYVVTQCIAGTFQLYPQVAMKYVKLAQLKIMHATSGLMLFTLATVSLILGMCSSWFTASVTGTSWYACVACPALMLLIILNQIQNSYLVKK